MTSKDKMELPDIQFHFNCSSKLKKKLSINSILANNSLEIVLFWIIFYEICVQTVFMREKMKY